MADVNLRQLIDKLNEATRKALLDATGLCASRTHFDVEMEHWLLKILDHGDTDLDVILKQFKIDPIQLHRSLNKSLSEKKTGNGDPPGFSPELVEVAKDAWMIGSVDLGGTQLRSGHLICALMQSHVLGKLHPDVVNCLGSISVETLKGGFYQVLADSPENTENPPSGSARASTAKQGPVAGTQTPSLDQFTQDVTAKAKAGEIDPVLERDAEIRQIADILTRRRQNNPILTGEAGVGKTAVVEGFALKIAAGDVPPPLQNVSIRSLDLALLQAGAGMKGEFEQRLKSVINEVKASPQPIILFIDEAHTMIGAGGQAGQGDAANLLKPALARGELRTIAATTWAEYKKYFEKDAALARRFQVVKVEEPDESSAIAMMNGMVDVLRDHHQVEILNEAIVDSVRLSSRYVSGRQLPDKSVSVLDTACARIGLSQSSTPAPVENCQQRIAKRQAAIAILEREMANGVDHSEALKELQEDLAEAEQQLSQLKERWDYERELVEKIARLSSATDESREPANTDSSDDQPSSDGEATEDSTPDETISDEERLAQLQELKKQLLVSQGDEPLVYAEVNAQAVAETVASWTGIPLGRMVADEIQTIMDLDTRMEESIVGQSHALKQIAQSIRTSRAGLGDPRTPIGVFLLAGTSGVGKTETAITLADLLYGGEQNMTTINMSEFKEEHKVSLLMGSPPGYVGYGEGGVLTEAVRRKPYSVILLDEMEKAHPSVQDVFYQVFDKGNMKDGEGRDIDFRNTVIIMTSNAGTDLIKNLCSDPELMPSPEGFEKAVFPELLKTFKPAFLGRLKVIPYFPLNDDVMRQIITLKLDKVRRRIKENHNATLEVDDAVVQTICDRCNEVDTGARTVDHLLSRSILPDLSAKFLAAMAEGKAITRARISMSPDDSFEYQIS